MAFIKMTATQGESYRTYLCMYRERCGKEPGPVERTEAFFCARSRDPWKRPSWVK
jgi:hypothetical protein